MNYASIFKQRIVKIANKNKQKTRAAFVMNYGRTKLVNFCTTGEEDIQSRSFVVEFEVKSF